jgi:transcriptional regulator with XRE-family HTH domain
MTAPNPMTPDELRECLGVIGWTQRELAEELGIDDRTVRLFWAMGRKPVPDNVAEWLRAIAAAHAARPEGWTRPSKRNAHTAV